MLASTPRVAGAPVARTRKADAVRSAPMANGKAVVLPRKTQADALSRRATVVCAQAEAAKVGHDMQSQPPKVRIDGSLFVKLYASRKDRVLRADPCAPIAGSRKIGERRVPPETRPNSRSQARSFRVEIPALHAWTCWLFTQIGDGTSSPPV